MKQDCNTLVLEKKSQQRSLVGFSQGTVTPMVWHQIRRLSRDSLLPHRMLTQSPRSSLAPSCTTLELPPSRGKWWTRKASKVSLAETAAPQLCFHDRGISSESHCSQILMHIIATWGTDVRQRKVGSQTSPVRADKGAGYLFFSPNTPAVFYWKIITFPPME